MDESMGIGRHAAVMPTISRQRSSSPFFFQTLLDQHFNRRETQDQHHQFGTDDSFQSDIGIYLDGQEDDTAGASDAADFVFVEDQDDAPSPELEASDEADQGESGAPMPERALARHSKRRTDAKFRVQYSQKLRATKQRRDNAGRFSK